MTKTYMGIPGTNGVPAAVSVVGQGSRPILGDFAWGKLPPLPNGKPDPNFAVHQRQSADLAKAILQDHLGSEAEAVRYYRRFMWRAVVTWSFGTPFTITGEAIDLIMSDIRASDSDAAKARSAVAATPVEVASESGIGPGGSPLSPIKMK